MRKSFSFLTLVCCGLWSASQGVAGTSICEAVTGNLVANCGFETGDFTSWALGGNTANPGANYYGVDGFDANSGADGAYMSQDFVDDGTAPLTLSQTISTTPGLMYNFTFFLEQDDGGDGPPQVGYTRAFSAMWGGATIQSVTPTVAVPGTLGSFTEYTFTETATAPSTVLSFAFENDDNYWSFDDVSVAAAQAGTPEPSTWLLAGLALSVLLFLRRVAARADVRT